MGALFKVYKSDGITEIANIKSVAFREAVNTGEYLIPGCVSSSEIEVEVFNTQPNAVAAGDVVYAYVYDNANNGTLLGKFNCEPRIDTKNSYKFVAYDNALKLEADFSQWLQTNQSNFPYTIKQLVQQACTIAGVTLGSSSWPLSSQSVQAFYADGLTCRDILSYAAELAGRFVRCHTDGNIYFDWFAANANSIAPSAGTGVYAYKQDGLTYANYTTTALARVAVHPSGEDDVAYIYPTGVTSGNTLHIKNNLLLTGADASFYNAAAQQVYTAVTAVGSYCPMSVNLFPRENPFRAGDIVSITDAQSVTISAPITGMTISNAAATLVSDGHENYEDTTETAKAITQLASDVVRINKLKVDWADINTAIINYLTANDVTAQNLTIVDANDNVLATFNANGITLGQTDEAHAELDFNSFILKDKNGSAYFSVGDARDINGKVNVTRTFVGDGSTTSFSLIPVCSEPNTLVVTVNGSAVSNYTVQHGNDLIFNTAPSADSSIVITYISDHVLYYYDIGTRANNSNIGSSSTVIGGGGTASGAWSTSIGLNNEASGDQSAVIGGLFNHATGRLSFAAGGQSNKAKNSMTAVVGGFKNEANSVYSAVIGGSNNKANGGGSAVVAGSYCTADGSFSAAFGQHTQALGHSSLAFGKYNIASATYAEVVGNGTADNARSNARTLDWSGNEYIAGALSVGDAATTRANIGAVNIAGDTMTGNLDISRAGETFARVNNTNTGITFSMTTGTSSNHGIISRGYYDGTFHSDNKWMIYRNSSGDIIVNGNCTGNAANVTGTVAVANGGTGATNATVALEHLGGFNLSLGRNIPDNSNLNDYKTAGTYYVADATHSATITNGPVNTAGYKLVVLYSGTTGQVHQEAYMNASFNRYYRYWNGATWSAWRINLTTANTIGIVNGGTGATTAATARANLGAAFYMDIPTSTDLNSLLAPGIYTSPTTIASVGTLLNCPSTAPFAMIVSGAGNSTIGCCQAILSSDYIYTRRGTSAGFGPWWRFTGTVVT